MFGQMRGSRYGNRPSRKLTPKEAARAKKADKYILISLGTVLATCIVGLIWIYSHPEECVSWGPEKMVPQFTSWGSYYGDRLERECLKWQPKK